MTILCDLRQRQLDRLNACLFWGYIVTGSIVFMSMPVIITFDTAHYHQYLRVFTGELSWQEWDPARGIVFPAVLKAVQFLFGFNPQAPLIFMWVCWIGSSWLLFRMIERLKVKRTGQLFVYSIVFLMMCNPIVLGYYHTLLTEFIAATGALFFAYMIHQETIGHRKRYSFVAAGLGMPLAWHLKQPFVSIILFVLIAAFIVTIVMKANRQRILMMLVIGLLSLFLSQLVWSSALPTYQNSNRKSGSFLSRQLVKGLSEFILKNQEQKDVSYDRAIDEGLVVSVFREKTFLFEHQFTGSFSNSLHYIRTAMVKQPGAVIHGYLRNYLIMINVISMNENDPRSLNLVPSGENHAIAYRQGILFGDASNIFWMPDELYRDVSGYQVHQRSKSISARAIYWRPIRDVSDAFFIGVFMLVPIMVVTSFIELLIRRKKIRQNNFARLSLVFILSFFGFFHVLMHAVLGATIDRYAFPALLPALCAVVIYVGHVLETMRENPSVRRRLERMRQNWRIILSKISGSPADFDQRLMQCNSKE